MRPLAIFGLALVVRLAHVFLIRTSPFFDFPIIDSATYDRVAWGHAQGRPLWDGAFPQPPLYPWFLGLVYRVLGHSLLGARIVQAVLGALSCLLVYGIGRKAFGRATATGAALIAALYGPLVFFDGEMLPAGLHVFLVLAGILLVLHAGESGVRRQGLRWLAAGAVLGLAALARPDVLAFLPLAALWASTMEGARARRALGAVLLVVGAGLPISIVTARNHRVAGDFVLISANGGLNFYLGNNPEAEETVDIRPGFAWNHLVNEPLVKAWIEKPSARSRYFLRKGISFWREHPSAALSLQGRKLALFWNSFEIGRNRDMYRAREDSSLLALLVWRIGAFGFPFGLLAPVAAAGLVAGFSSEKKRLPLYLLYLFLLAQTAAVVLFFVASRYRLPVVPVLALFAAHYAVWVWERVRAGRWRPALLSLVPMLIAFPVVNHRVPGLDRAFRGETDRYLGVRYADEGRQAEAERAYRRALAEAPDHAEAHAELAQLLQAGGRHAEALPHFQRAAEICPFSEETHYLLGTGYAAVSDTARAEAELRAAIAIAPYARAYRDLGVLLLDRGRLGEAGELLGRAARLDPEDLDTWYKLGQCCFLRGSFAEAEAALREALRLAPGDREIMEKIESLGVLLRVRP